jgi:hypothetical protein
MLPTVAASAAAARALDYRGLADMIEIEQLSRERILTLLKLSMSERASHDCAVVLFAGSIARYRVQQRGWDGHLEEQLAIEALASEANPTAAFSKTSKEAARRVARHWQAIAGNPAGAAPRTFQT